MMTKTMRLDLARIRTRTLTTMKATRRRSERYDVISVFSVYNFNR
jgi:hypothetical protein